MAEKFQSLESKMNKPLTYLLMGLIWLVVLIVAYLVCYIMYDLFDYGIKNYFLNKTSDLFFNILISVALSLCCLFLVYTLILPRKKFFHKVIVNEKGIVIYNYKGEIVKEVFYSNLQPSRQNSYSDIHHRDNAQLTKTTIVTHTKNETGTIEEDVIDLYFDYFIIKNRYDLHRHFLLGIQTFRPDLKIYPLTLERYYLTPETKNIKPNTTGAVLIISGFIIIVFGAIYALVLLLQWYYK